MGRLTIAQTHLYTFSGDEMASQFTFKTGQTFAPVCTYTSPPPVPASIAGKTIKSQIRQKVNGSLIVTLSVIIISEGTGQYTFSPVDTTGWPHGSAVWDIFYESGGVNVATDTIEFTIIPNVTAP